MTGGPGGQRPTQGSTGSPWGGLSRDASWWLSTRSAESASGSSGPDERRSAREHNMKRRRRGSGRTEVRKEYDFSRGVRGKYARRYVAGTNIVVLDPDVAKVFRDSRSVNQALRALTIIARQQRRKAS